MIRKNLLPLGRVVAVLLVLMLVITTGCSSQQGSGSSNTQGDQQEGSGENPIVVGMVQPLSGPVAAAGIAVRDGGLIAVDEINSTGGINGRPLKLVIEDGENDPAKSVSASEKLITRDNVVALIAAWGSSPTVSVAPLAKRYEVPQLAETAGTYKLTDPEEAGNPWTFRLCAADMMEATSSEFLVNELGFKKVFFLPVNSDWGRGAYKYYGEAMKPLGVEDAGVAFYDQSETNFKPILTKAKSSGADTLIASTDVSTFSEIVKQAYELGIDANILVTGGSTNPEKVIELVGKEAAEGVYIHMLYQGAYEPEKSANPEAAKRFNQTWKDKGYHWSEVTEGARGYDEVMTLAEALKSLPSDGITRATVREALEKVEYQGIMFGNVKFREWRNLINQNWAPHSVAQIVNGQVEFVLDAHEPQP